MERTLPEGTNDIAEVSPSFVIGQFYWNSIHTKLCVIAAFCHVEGGKHTKEDRFSFVRKTTNCVGEAFRHFRQGAVSPLAMFADDKLCWMLSTDINLYETLCNSNCVSLAVIWRFSDSRLYPLLFQRKLGRKWNRFSLILSPSQDIFFTWIDAGNSPGMPNPFMEVLAIKFMTFSILPSANQSFNGIIPVFVALF